MFYCWGMACGMFNPPVTIHVMMRSTEINHTVHTNNLPENKKNHISGRKREMFSFRVLLAARPCCSVPTLLQCPDLASVYRPCCSVRWVLRGLCSFLRREQAMAAIRRTSAEPGTIRRKPEKKPSHWKKPEKVECRAFSDSWGINGIISLVLVLCSTY